MKRPAENAAVLAALVASGLVWAGMDQEAARGVAVAALAIVGLLPRIVSPLIDWWRKRRAATPPG